ncbi:MAG: YbaB/EbfC family nucleoid-associated protein [Patescibacteria group bacterium]
MLDKLKQLKDLRDQAKQLEATLAQETVTGVAAANKVSIEMNGNQNIQSINIEPELLSPDKKPELEEALKEAHIDCMQKIKQLMAQKLYSSGMNIPGTT